MIKKTAEGIGIGLIILFLLFIFVVVPIFLELSRDAKGYLIEYRCIQNENEVPIYRNSYCFELQSEDKSYTYFIAAYSKRTIDNTVLDQAQMENSLIKINLGRYWPTIDDINIIDKGITLIPK